MKKPILFTIFICLFLNIFSQNLILIKLDDVSEVYLDKNYNIAESFVLEGQQFLFCHNFTTGQTDIWNLSKGGNIYYSKKWSTGWTNINFYTFKKQLYFFHQKEGTGLARIIKVDYKSIMSDESLGEKIYEDTWSKGWSSTKFFVNNNIIYFLHYKKDSGLARLNASFDPSNPGKLIYEKNWAKNYTNFSMISDMNNFYLLYQQESEGSCVINRIDLIKLETAAKAGLVSPNLGIESYREKWSSGWSYIEFFNYKNKNYLFFNKSTNGTARIEEFNDKGTLSTRVYDTKWSSGWDNLSIFYMYGEVYLLHQKSTTGLTKISKIVE